MIKYIFFDNDGVLVDTEKYFFKATHEILLKQGIALTKEKFIELTLVGNEGGWRLAREKGFSELQINEMREERNELYAGYLAENSLLIKGVKNTISILSNKYNLGIVTSSKRSHFDLIHKNTGILHYFNFALAREDYAKSKPSPEPYLKALETAGCKKEECIVVEDSERGVNAAAAAGIKCIAIPDSLTVTSDFSKAETVLNNVEQLLAVL